VKALVIPRPGALEVRDVPEPSMGPYDARCEMLYGATCTGTDLALIDGRFHADVIAYPAVLGHESVGRVLAVGAKVRAFRPGDLVTRVYTRPTGGLSLCWGGMCEFGLACDYRAMRLDGLPRAQWDKYRINLVIPEGIIDPMGATMMITWRENLSFVNRLGVGPGARALISGSGANGLSIAAFCALKGAETVVVGSGARRDAALALGVAGYADYRDAEAVAALAAGGRAFDFLIDATGRRHSLDPFLPALRDGGTASVYGMDDLTSYAVNPMLGPASWRFRAAVYDEAETHEEVVGLLRADRLDPYTLLDRSRVYTWADAPDAYEAVRAKRAVKALISLSGRN
jgi:L-iditol 2-dehydrogenase